MRKVLILTIASLAMFAGSAMAASIDGRFGITGRAGALVPLQDDFIKGADRTRPGLAAGGGIIFGVGRGLAVEIDATHVNNFDVEYGGGKAFEAKFTDIGIGLQYRMLAKQRLVPFIGLGADFIKGNIRHVTGAKYNLDWTEGGHVNAGLDFFITRGIALSMDARGIFAFKGDVKSGATKVGEYDPMSFVGTVGVRLMLPDKVFW